MRQISISAGIDHDIKRFATLATKILRVAENDVDEMLRNPIQKMLNCAKDLKNPSNVAYVKTVLNYILDSDLMPLDMVKTAKAILDELSVATSVSSRHTKAARRRQATQDLHDKTQEIRDDEEDDDKTLIVEPY